MIDDRREAPANVRSLNDRIRNLAKTAGRPENQLARAIANTVVAQMITVGVVKGGTAMKLRLGDSASRFTPDFDTSRRGDVPLDVHVEEITGLLERGWNGFAGRLAHLPAYAPADVPDDYVMRPFSIHLTYRGSNWLKVKLELGREEVGTGDHVENRIVASELREHFAVLGLEDPAPVLLLAAEPQAVQKLHACTSISPDGRANERAHDLVDLQLLEQTCEIDLALVARIGRRLFASRGKQHGRRRSWLRACGRSCTHGTLPGSKSCRPSKTRSSGRTDLSGLPARTPAAPRSRRRSAIRCRRWITRRSCKRSPAAVSLTAAAPST